MLKAVLLCSGELWTNNHGRRLLVPISKPLQRQKLQPERIGLGRAVRTLRRQGSHGVRLFEPDIGVEPVGEDRLEIMAEKLGVGPVDDADRPLEQRLAQGVRQRACSVRQSASARLSPVRRKAYS